MSLPRLFALLPLLALPAGAFATPQTETLVFLRHAEKQPDDLGQLTCQGLNRALALPPRLKTLFGNPDYLFAPNPGVPNHGFNYIRPLATIEPTAIQLRMPVNTHYGYDDLDGLMGELDQPRYRQSMVWIAWEHNMIEKLLKRMAARYPTSGIEIDKWPGKEFDRLAVVTLTRDGNTVRMGYRIQQQNLNGMAETCP
ncbi:hypothetical protein [Paludibacterium purpuratum]|uniref:Histidine phosphatase family protein n=1 Tax=Paludibacterium purpuratum TaxID=1144873 RepID=A0A4R7AWT7_9NEIS|nr:hypothetical protein [Paludibacterium purpuratum]TDR71616.1 hypothetical protein DFP86_11827 [Paludibacterium purpuratum]